MNNVNKCAYAVNARDKSCMNNISYENPLYFLNKKN